jgi:rRNA processing protein Krr1/Pno1
MSDIARVMDFMGVDEEKAKHLIKSGFDIESISTENVIRYGKKELENIKSKLISEANEVREEIEAEISHQHQYFSPDR